MHRYLTRRRPSSTRRRRLHAGRKLPESRSGAKKYSERLPRSRRPPGPQAPLGEERHVGALGAAGPARPDHPPTYSEQELPRHERGLLRLNRA